MEFNLVDDTLYYLNTSKYQNSLVSDRHPKYFTWTKDRFDLPSFYTYTKVNRLNEECSDNNTVLLESSSIIGLYCKYIEQNSDKFNIIYTHNSALLNSCNNARWIPGGGCWIGTEFGGCEAKVFDKTKLCSFTSSDKTMCDLHKIRFETWKFLRSKTDTIDYYGTLTSGFVKPSEYLKDYMFSIIFENHIDELYFTEKILNCFATGTIPIYLGASKIDSIFNIDGIIRFKNPKELIEIVNDGISKEIYLSKLNAIKDNFTRATKFYCIEDYMWENYMEKQYAVGNSC